MSARGGKMFRGGGKFLRPQQQYDDESSEEESEEEEEEEEDNKKPGSDYDEDEDDSEEDIAPKRKVDTSSSAAPQAKRPKASSFFDEEAQDSGDEDDDEPYGTHKDPHDVVKKHYTEEDIRREQMDEEARELIRQQDRRRAQAGGRFGVSDDDLSVEEMARDIEDRHRRHRRTVDRSILDRAPVRRRRADDDEDEPSSAAVDASYTAVSQQSLVPSVSDPSLWMISCATGKEENLVYQIMNKCIAYARQGRPLEITACVAAQSKGRIYIESYNEPPVMQAIQGVRGLLVNTMRLIPIGDMTTVMAVTQKKKPVKKNEWVRMTRGHYKGDLALVKSVRDSGLKCVVQCVPRLDLSLSDMSPEAARSRRRKFRPPQKFFNTQEVAAMGKQTLKRQRFPGLDIFCDHFEGNYYHDGYLLKEMSVGSMVKPCTDEEPPTLDELQRFRRSQKSKDSQYDDEDDDGEENEGSKLAASLLDELSELQGKTGLAKNKTSGGLLIGDTIEVIEGDLVGLRGKLVSLDGATVKVKPSNSKVDLGGMEEVEFLANQVRKYIPVGARVKIMDGRYANETGNVVAVEQLEGETDCTAVVLTHVTNKEITVRTSQLRESTEMAFRQDELAGYRMYDLVVLSGGGASNEVGVIVRVGREDFTVINNHGIIREVRPEELRGKRNGASNRALAVDVQGNQIRVGDQVNVTDGPHKGKQATIKCMSRTQLFLYSQTRMENAGIFVVRSRSCLVAGSKTQRRGGGGDPRASPFTSPRGGGGGPQRGKRSNDALVGKTVRIQSGQWKGYIGTVCDSTATHVKVELHSRLKKVMVVKERVAVAGDKYGSTEDPSRNVVPPTSMMAPTTPFNPTGATPMHGGATPMHGGATPMHGGATPMHDSGGGDEVWRPGGAIDKDPSSNADDENESSSVWGSSNDQSNPFGSNDNDTGDGWGSSSGSAWGQSNGNDNSASGDGNSSSQDRVSVNAGTDATGDGDGAPVWFMERVCVQVKSDGSSGVIKEINGKSAVVDVDGTTKNKRVSELSMVAPKEHDMVLVTGGADVGIEGELVCIDDKDAILKDANEDFKIVDFSHLAKISTGDS